MSSTSPTTAATSFTRQLTDFASGQAPSPAARTSREASSAQWYRCFVAGFMWKKECT